MVGSLLTVAEEVQVPELGVGGGASRGPRPPLRPQAPPAGCPLSSVTPLPVHPSYAQGGLCGLLPGALRADDTQAGVVGTCSHTAGEGVRSSDPQVSPWLLAALVYEAGLGSVRTSLCSPHRHSRAGPRVRQDGTTVRGECSPPPGPAVGTQSFNVALFSAGSTASWSSSSHEASRKVPEPGPRGRDTVSNRPPSLCAWKCEN